MADLFDHTDLSDYLRKPVTEESAVSVERVVWGWLKPALGLSVRPDPVPDDLFSYAIELAAIAYENPLGLSATTIGPFRYEFSAERRLEILAAVGGTTVGAPATPLGSFPDAVPWPDPARLY